MCYPGLQGFHLATFKSSCLPSFVETYLSAKCFAFNFHVRRVIFQDLAIEFKNKNVPSLSSDDVAVHFFWLANVAMGNGTISSPLVHFFSCFSPAGNGWKSIGMEHRVLTVQVFSWLPAGQSSDAVIHRPDLELSMT